MKSFIIPLLIIIVFFFASCKLANEEDESIVIDFDQIPAATLVTNSHALITWETLDSLGGAFYYGLNKNALINSIEFDASPNVQNITLSNLLTDTEYLYTLSFNFEGTVVETDTLTIRTKNIDYNINSDSESYQREVIKKLTGEQAIGDSVSLTKRFDLTDRAIAAQYLANELSIIGINPYYQYFSGGANVFGTIDATVETDENIVIGAHYDTVHNSPGANDNASGVALVLSVAKELVKLNSRTKNVIVSFFDIEEYGLVGSWFFADSLKSANTIIHSVHTIDQVAWDEDEDQAIELEMPDFAIEYLYRSVNSESINIPIHITTARSDHVSFREIGYSAVGITEEYRNGDTTPHRHHLSDTYDTINFDYLKNTTQFVYFALKTLLNQ